MHFKLKDRATDKQVAAFLKLPPFLRKKLVYMRWIGGAFAYGIEHRFRKHEVTASGKPGGPFYRSGGMWSGWESQISGKRVKVQFNRSTKPSHWALKAEKTFKDNKARKRWEKRQRAAGRHKGVRNRDKARWAQRTLNGEQIAEPSRGEVNPLLSWMETHIERNVFAIAASRYDKKPLPDRYNLMLPRLPNPKTSN